MNLNEELELVLIKQHKGSRKKPKKGDLFFQQLVAGGEYVWGLVVDANARVEPVGGLLLIYFCEIVTKEDTFLFPADAIKDHLLIPPVITNRQGWLRGFYQTLANVPVDASCKLAQHCFKGFAPNTFFDEFDRPISKETEPCGFAGVSGLLGIAESIAERVKELKEG